MKWNEYFLMSAVICLGLMFGVVVDKVVGPTPFFGLFDVNSWPLTTFLAAIVAHWMLKLSATVNAVEAKLKNKE